MRTFFPLVPVHQPFILLCALKRNPAAFPPLCVIQAPTTLFPEPPSSTRIIVLICNISNTLQLLPCHLTG